MCLNENVTSHDFCIQLEDLCLVVDFYKSESNKRNPRGNMEYFYSTVLLPHPTHLAIPLPNPLVPDYVCTVRKSLCLF